MANSVHVVHVRLTSDYCLDYYVFDLCHDLVGISPLRQQNLKNSCQAPFMPFLLIPIIIIFFIIVPIFIIFIFCLFVILLKVIIKLINCIISQMDKHIVHVSIPWLFVWLCCKPSKSLLVDQNSQWVQAIEHYIDTQVILKVFNNVRICQVVLDNPTSALVGAGFNNFFAVSRKVNSATLSEIIWFNDKSFSSINRPSLSIYKLVSKFTSFTWKNESSRKKLKFVWESSSHFHQVSGQIIFLCYLIDTWKLVYFLVGQ